MSRADDPRICEGRSRWWWEGYDDRMRGKPFAIQTTESDWRAGWSTADLNCNRIGITEGVDCFLVNVPDCKDRDALEAIKDWMCARGVRYPVVGWTLCMTRGSDGLVTVFTLPTYALAFEFLSTFG